jgi:hypothetical protein
MSREMIPESDGYDNYLDKKSKDNDRYRTSLEKFIDDFGDALVDETVKKNSQEDYKSIYAHFRNLDDLCDFCRLINISILPKMKEIYYPQTAPNALFGDEPITIDRNAIAVNTKKKSERQSDDFYRMHWKGMPEYVQEDDPPYRSIIVRFRSEEGFDQFSRAISQKMSDKTKSIWHPKLKINKIALLRWVEQ